MLWSLHFIQCCIYKLKQKYGGATFYHPWWGNNQLKWVSWKSDKRLPYVHLCSGRLSLVPVWWPPGPTSSASLCLLHPPLKPPGLGQEVPSEPSSRCKPWMGACPRTAAETETEFWLTKTLFTGFEKKSWRNYPKESKGVLHKRYGLVLLCHLPDNWHWKMKWNQ